MNVTNAPRTAAKFESMRTRRISDMTELWDYAAELERENAKLRGALVRATGSLGLVIRGADADALGHKGNYVHARKVLAETESD